MLSRRKRFIVHCQANSTLFHIREALGKSVELIVAADATTVEAALRLYRQMAGLIVEHRPKTELPESMLKLACDISPQMPRIGLFDLETVRAAQSALSKRLVTRLVFTPFSSAELQSAVNAKVELSVAG